MVFKTDERSILEWDRGEEVEARQVMDRIRIRREEPIFNKNEKDQWGRNTVITVKQK